MHAIITPKEMYTAEQRVIAEGVTGFELMLRAGNAVGDILHRAYPTGHISVLCGPGGNGGDGFVAAARLAQLGRDVFVYALTPLQSLKGDARQAAAMWTKPVAPLASFNDRGDGVVLDALFGGGLSRAPSGRTADLVNSIDSKLVAVDVPSGLDGASACPLGACFSADLTITFAALRPAHVLSPGRVFCGAVEIVDIGVPVPDHIRTCETLAPAGANILEIPNEDTLHQWIKALDHAPINRIDAVRALSQQRKTNVVLKSPEALLAKPNGEVIVQVTSRR